MNDHKPVVGEITWMDLTVPDADAVRIFYHQVVGWDASPVDMGGYEDYCMTMRHGGGIVGGICHARGSNADLPAQWLVYITVDDLDASATRAEELGGEVVAGPKALGEYGRYCVVKDPAGAVSALFEPKAEST